MILTDGAGRPIERPRSVPSGIASDMKHDELARLAANWLRKKKRLPVVLQDVKCMMTSEHPDAIAWNNSGFSVLVECKVYPADLFRDADKPFRKFPERGMGNKRWFAFPSGFLAAYPRAIVHCPGLWGIVEIDDRGRAKVLRDAHAFPEWNRFDELRLLVQAVRKATEGWGRRTFGDIAPPTVDGDPHPTASKVIRDLRNENTKLRAELRRHQDEIARLRNGGLPLRLHGTRIEHKLG